jgi:hypothetical protein
MNINMILSVARKHLTENSNGSDRFCMYEAVKAQDRGDYPAAMSWARKSLAHSVGIFHVDYRKVSASIDKKLEV